MRSTIATATFALLGAGAASVGAAAIDLQGSDTLKGLTRDIVLNHCTGAAGINYIGGGSGTGAFAMLNLTQQVAPMSRAIKNPTECSLTATLPTTAEMMVVAFDGLSMMGNLETAPGCGLANTGTIAVDGAKNGVAGTQCPSAGGSECPSNIYTIRGWQDVLRIIYADNSTNADGTLNKSTNCNSDLRWSLVDNWSSLFKGTCSPGAGGTTCGALKHAFRRDDLSGTTDAFLALLGLQGTNSANLVAGAVQITWNNPFCNGGKDPVLHDAAHGGSGVVTNLRVVLDKTDGTGDPSAVSPQPLNHFGDRFATFMDFDPIRRACTSDGNADPAQDLGAGPGSNLHGEQVCGPKGDVNGNGDLGLVLVISPADNLSVAANYPIQPCTEGKFSFIQGPDFPYGCPNGTKTLFGKCYTPAFQRPDLTFDFACLNEIDNTPVFSPGNTDGRAYNLYVRDSAGNLLVDGEGLAAIGAWSRIHSSASITGVTCKVADATQQIGCLVGASPCSIGFAGHSADQQAHTQTLLVDNSLPTVANVQFATTGTAPPGATIKYPLSRKLYFNTIVGWDNVTGPELGLAKCMADNAGGTFFGNSGGVVGMRGSASSEVVAQGFFDTVGGVTSCEPACGNTVAGVCTGNSAPFPTTKVW